MPEERSHQYVMVLVIAHLEPWRKAFKFFFGSKVTNKAYKIPASIVSKYPYGVNMKCDFDVKWYVPKSALIRPTP